MKAIKAKEVEKKFDDGEDISRYLDLSKARRPEREQKKAVSDLDRLSGTWRQNDLTEFKKKTADFEKVDAEMWK